MKLAALLIAACFLSGCRPDIGARTDGRFLCEEDGDGDGTAVVDLGPFEVQP